MEKPINRPKEEIQRLANYVKGFADAKESSQLAKAAEWLEKASRQVCAQGFIGCKGGDNCNSDHK